MQNQVGLGLTSRTYALNYDSKMCSGITKSRFEEKEINIWEGARCLGTPLNVMLFRFRRILIGASSSVSSVKPKVTS